MQKRKNDILQQRKKSQLCNKKRHERQKNNVHVVFFDVRAKSIDKEGKCEYTVMRI